MPNSYFIYITSGLKRTSEVKGDMNFQKNIGLKLGVQLRVSQVAEKHMQFGSSCVVCDE